MQVRRASQGRSAKSAMHVNTRTRTRTRTRNRNRNRNSKERGIDVHSITASHSCNDRHWPFTCSDRPEPAGIRRITRRFCRRHWWLRHWHRTGRLQQCATASAELLQLHWRCLACGRNWHLRLQRQPGSGVGNDRAAGLEQELGARITGASDWQRHIRWHGAVGRRLRSAGRHSACVHWNWAAWRQQPIRVHRSGQFLRHFDCQQPFCGCCQRRVCELPVQS